MSSLPNNFYHQIYWSDLPVLFIVRNTYPYQNYRYFLLLEKSKKSNLKIVTFNSAGKSDSRGVQRPGDSARGQLSIEICFKDRQTCELVDVFS